MRNSGYQNIKSFLLGYTHISLGIGTFYPIGVAYGGQAFGAVTRSSASSDWRDMG